MKVGKILLICVFIIIIFIEIFMLFANELSFKYSHVLLMLLMIFLLLHRNKLTGIMLLIICLYGVFDFFNSTHKNDSTFMAFTSALNTYFFNDGSDAGSRRILVVYPLCFYLGTSIALIANYFKMLKVKHSK